VGKDNYILQCQNQTGEASDRLIVKVKVVSADTVKVACVGDSITWGVGSADINVNYPILLEEKLGEGYVVANFGISATSMIEKAGNGYSTRVSYDFSLAMLPDIVIIMLGTNDANLGIWNTRKAQFYDDCIKMIEAYQKLPSHPDVYVATSPYVKETIATISENTVKNEVNPLQRQAAEAMGCGLIDIHAVTEGHPEYFYDGVHPNETGYPVIAEAMYQGLQNSQDRKAAGMTVKTVAEYDYLISGAYLLEEDTNTSTEPPMSTSKDTTSDSTLITQEVQSKSASAFRLMPYLTGAAVVLMAEALVAIIMMLCKKNKA
jgi:lysophospholipase L1-like esterase